MTDEVTGLSQEPLTNEEPGVDSDARLAALQAEGELPAPEPSDLPKFRCELTCPTPVAARVADYHAETAAQAELFHRQANGLVGAVAGGVRVTPLKLVGEEWVDA